MPLAQTIFIFSVALALAAAASLVRADLRRRLTSPRGWAALAGAALFLSAASWLLSSRDAAGTGTVTRNGWPKPFHFGWESWEDASGFESFSLLYFIGNSLVYAGALLLIWTLAALARPDASNIECAP